MGVQCEVQPEAGASALEDKVNAVLPLQTKDGDLSEQDGQEEQFEDQAQQQHHSEGGRGGQYHNNASNPNNNNTAP